MGENKDKEYITHPDNRGSINISEDVIAMIAANAASEIDGVSGLYASLGKDIADRLSKKSSAKGVKVQVNENNAVTIDVYILVKIGFAVNTVAETVQGNVYTAVESMTGFTITSVNIHVCGVTLDKDK